jgi:hypothetical protein
VFRFEAVPVFISPLFVVGDVDNAAVVFAEVTETAVYGIDAVPVPVCLVSDVDPVPGVGVPVNGKLVVIVVPVAPFEKTTV